MRQISAQKEIAERMKMYIDVFDTNKVRDYVKLSEEISDLRFESQVKAIVEQKIAALASVEDKQAKLDTELKAILELVNKIKEENRMESMREEFEQLKTDSKATMKNINESIPELYNFIIENLSAENLSNFDNYVKQKFPKSAGLLLDYKSSQTA